HKAIDTSRRERYSRSHAPRNTCNEAESFMLTWLRGKTGSFMVKILLGLLVISFAVWGISGQIFTGVGNHVVAVGDTRVSVNEYRLAYDRQIQLLSQQFGTRITREQARAFGLEQQVLAQLVAGAALDEQAREMR